MDHPPTFASKIQGIIRTETVVLKQSISCTKLFFSQQTGFVFFNQRTMGLSMFSSSVERCLQTGLVWCDSTQFNTALHDTCSDRGYLPANAVFIAVPAALMLCFDLAAIEA